MSEIKLKRCPFCGGEADLFSWAQIPLNYQYGIECRECHTLFQINQYDTTMQETIEKWNTRKPMQDIVERLEDAKHGFSGGSLQTVYYQNGVIDAIEIVKEVGGSNAN